MVNDGHKFEDYRNSAYIWFTAWNYICNAQSYDAISNNSKNTTKPIKYSRQRTTCTETITSTLTQTDRQTKETDASHQHDNMTRQAEGWDSSQGVGWYYKLRDDDDAWLQNSMQWLVLQVRTTTSLLSLWWRQTDSKSAECCSVGSDWALVAGWGLCVLVLRVWRPQLTKNRNAFTPLLTTLQTNGRRDASHVRPNLIHEKKMQIIHNVFGKMKKLHARSKWL